MAQNRNPGKTKKNHGLVHKYKKHGKTYAVRIDRIVEVAVCIIVLIIILVSCVNSCSKSQKRRTATDLISNTEESTENDVRQPQQTEYSLKTTETSIKENQLYCGNLILINNENPYTFSENDTNLVSIAENKTDSYNVIDSTYMLDSETVTNLNNMMDDFYKATKKDDLTILSAYRSYDDQNAKYEEGQAATKAGFSEYHSGRTFALGTNDDGSTNYYSPDSKYKWIDDHAADYGFIKRYPAGKSSYTGEDEINYIFRYVGLPHSKYIADNNLCLEEYLNLIKKYSYDNPFEIDVNNDKYLVYFAEATLNQDTKVQVPDTTNSGTTTISGNNSDGFIITYKE